MTFPQKKKMKPKNQQRKYENYKLIDVLKEIKIKQGIIFHSPNNINTQIEKFRKYEVNMIMEHYKNIEEYFNLKKEDIIIILKEELIPILAKP